MEGGVEYGESNLESRQSDHPSASSQKWLKVISGEGRIIFCPSLCLRSALSTLLPPEKTSRCLQEKAMSMRHNRGVGGNGRWLQYFMPRPQPDAPASFILASQFVLPVSWD